MRIVIFTDVNADTTTRLVRATLRQASEVAGCSVVGIVTTRPTVFRHRLPDRVLPLLRRAVVAASNPEVPWRSVLRFELDLFRLGRTRGIPVLVPPAGDPNDAEFVRALVTKLRPDVLLSYYCRHRLGRTLRSSFAHAVNYHDGLLPDYRGVMATSFSIFAGESESGLTFHRMSARLDEGPILLQVAVPIDERSTLAEVSERKSQLAVDALPRVLERVAAEDPGRPQRGEGSYFSFHDWMAMIHLAEPANATRGEILRRIRAFGVVHLTIDGEVHAATRLRAARPGDRLAFRTGDDHLLAPDRFSGLPRAFRWLDRASTRIRS